MLFNTIDEPDDNSDKYKLLNNKLDKQNNDLVKAKNIHHNIIDTQTKTAEALVDQRKRLENTKAKLEEVEQTLSIQDQIFGVMNNRELYSKAKLVFIIILLFFANLIVLYIKF